MIKKENELLEKKIERLKNYSDLIRKTMLDMYANFGFGCISGSFSVVELYAALYLHHLDTDKIVKNDPERTRVIPKGTGMLALYSTLSAAGIMEMDRLKHYGGDLLRPMPHIEVVGIDSSSFILGPAPGNAIGLSLAAKIKGISYQTICFIGDGEMQEGVDQAAKTAASLDLNNLCLIVDCNGLQSFYKTTDLDPTTIPDSNGELKRQQKLWEAYGWTVKEINGHNFTEIISAYDKIGKTKKPYVILARTIKGKGIPGAEDKLGFQHKISKETLDTTKKYYNNRVISFDSSVSLMNNKPSEKKKQSQQFRLPNNFTDNDFEEKFDSESLSPITTKWLYQLIDKNPSKIVLLEADCPKLYGPKSQFDIYAKENPKCPHVFPGLNEKLMFAIAKGLSYENLYPIVASPTTHAINSTEEWAELCIERLPVLFIGTKPGATFSDWGPSHCSFDDINSFNKPNVHIYQPSNKRDLIWILNKLYSDPEKNLPAFLRLIDFDIQTKKHAESEPSSWEKGYYIVSGENHNSDYLTLIATGDFMQQATELQNIYGGTNRIKVVNMFNLTQIDSGMIQKDLSGSSKIVSLVEARARSISDAIFTSLSPSEKSVYEPMGIDEGMYIDTPDVINNGDFYNARRYVLRKNGLDTESLAKRLCLMED